MQILQFARQQVVARRLGEHRFILVASPDYISEHGAPQSSDQLNHHPVVMYRTPHGVLKWVANI